jgi:hypothetical protein
MRLSLRYPHRSKVGRPAVAAVEMAVLVPVLAAIMLGLFELSRGMQVKQILTGAARKGCRTGIIHQYGNVDINSDVIAVMQNNGFDPSKFNPPTLGAISIIVTDPSGNTLADALDAPPGSTVSVQVSIPVSSITWGTTMFLPGGVLASDQIVMMKQ